MSLDDVRRSYASKIGLRTGIRSERLLQALAEVPRERFLGPGPWIIAGSPAMKPAETPNADPTHIYDDVSVALDASQNLYNGAPGVLIPWINALDLKEGASVFHLGGGAGYYTAIIAKVVGARGRVVMAEVDEKLGSRARQLLSEFQNVEVIVGDGGLHDPGPCDAILVNAGVTHPRQLWLSRLNDGGRLLLPLTFQFPNSNLGKGALLKITREHGAFAAAFVPSAAPVVIFSCSGVRDEVINEQLLKAYSTRIQSMGEVRSLRLDRHDADSTCWVHADVMCLSAKPKSSSA